MTGIFALLNQDKIVKISNGCFKDHSSYQNKDLGEKPQTETCSVLQTFKSGLEGN